MLSNLYGKKLESSLSQLVDYGKSWSLESIIKVATHCTKNEVFH